MTQEIHLHLSAIVLNVYYRVSPAVYRLQRWGYVVPHTPPVAPPVSVLHSVVVNLYHY